MVAETGGLERELLKYSVFVKEIRVDLLIHLMWEVRKAIRAMND
jgi:hypothetical protein